MTCWKIDFSRQSQKGQASPEDHPPTLCSLWPCMAAILFFSSITLFLGHKAARHLAQAKWNIQVVTLIGGSCGTNRYPIREQADIDRECPA